MKLIEQISASDPSIAKSYLKKTEICLVYDILELNEVVDGAETVILFLDLVMKKYYFLRTPHDGRGEKS